MPLTLSQTQDLLRSLGHSPRKQLGQNYLVDGNIVRKSLELGGVGAGDVVVEVGPGLGTLTGTLLEAGARVWAIEHDATMAAHLRRHFTAALGDSLHLQEGDALDDPLAGLPVAIATGGFKIIANLPYAISTPWMDAVLQGPLPDRMVLMLQLEAAQRYRAAPGTKQFGAISIFLQSAYRIAPGHKVARSCFFPAPDVDSYLLQLERLETPFRFTADVRQLIRGCFQQRRKQIAALLRGRLPDDGAAWITSLAEHGLNGQARPEMIPFAAWQRLAAA